MCLQSNDFSEYVINLRLVKKQLNIITPSPTGMPLPDTKCSAKRKGKHRYPDIQGREEPLTGPIRSNSGR